MRTAAAVVVPVPTIATPRLGTALSCDVLAEPGMELEQLRTGLMASDMAAIDACITEWITVSSDVLSICVTMVGVSVTAGVDEAAADSAGVVGAPSVGKRTGESRLICSGPEPVGTR